MLSSRPYLLRALNEWIVDSGLTPHLLIDAENPYLDVPDSARQDGKVVLNISPSAVRDLLMDDELVTFVARFGGVSRAVSVPVDAVQAIYARENGQGMMFPEDDEPEASDQDESGAQARLSPDKPGKPGPARRPSLKVVK
jgi:stringent starvation protein B